MADTNGSRPNKTEPVDCPVVTDLATVMEAISLRNQSPRPRIISTGIAGKQEFCLVCGIFRSDPDPTGVTCGRPDCLETVGRQAATKIDLQGVLDEISKKLKLSDKEDIADAVDNLLEATETAAEVAALLGIDAKESNPASIADDIKSAVSELVSITNQLKEIIARDHAGA